MITKAFIDQVITDKFSGIPLKKSLVDKGIVTGTNKPNYRLFKKALINNGYEDFDFVVVGTSGVKRPYRFSVGGSQCVTSSWSNGPITKPGRLNYCLVRNGKVSIAFTCGASGYDDSITIQLTRKKTGKKLSAVKGRPNNQSTIIIKQSTRVL